MREVCVSFVVSRLYLVLLNFGRVDNMRNDSHYITGFATAGFSTCFDLLLVEIRRSHLQNQHFSKRIYRLCEKLSSF